MTPVPVAPSARSALLLPESKLACRRGGDDAAPARRPLTRGEHERGPEEPGPIGRLVHVLDRHVGQPYRTGGGGLDDPAADPAPELEGEVGARRGVDLLLAPAAQMAVEPPRAWEIVR